ncbi:uncharacterized protein K452DRAFT_291790 [Aplosporella prunicola CBS 121167]|uniref:Uncharacterized protein n=1 Tax=Aplosporella prunicola CBS 121167 TaxID=1176127 RepID=A0A6A6AZQ7_9PEZI|nr:uncharacterized protein K452DRAFT_291790 [Aplosporella prunicola CBS 121167]KAF2137136.1 hypothetical protein K452DRAFT_291790 [Aplosporella prunicola CBS 121167]
MPALAQRDLSINDEINITFGVLATILALSSVVIGIATWQHQVRSARPYQYHSDGSFEFAIRVGRSRIS